MLDGPKLAMIKSSQWETDTIPTDSVPTDAIPTIHSQDNPVHI